jgi:hypothetical protein
MEFWPLKTLSKVSGVLLGLQLSLTPNMGVHLGVWGFTPSHSLHFLHSRGHVMWLSGLLLGPQPLNFLALAASQMLGLRQFIFSLKFRVTPFQRWTQFLNFYYENFEALITTTLVILLVNPFWPNLRLSFNI